MEASAESEERLNEETLNALHTSDQMLGINVGEPIGGAPSDGQTSGHAEEDTTNVSNSDIPNRPDLQRDNGEAGASTVPCAPQNNVNSQQLDKERIKDAKALEDAMRNLFDGSTNSNLGATVMLVNLVATHPCITKKAADDIFVTMKCLLPPDNNLPRSLYQAKTLTNRLGLQFTNIDGCPNGCVLFDKPVKKDLDRCTMSEAPKYKDMFRRTRLLKVLRYLRLTPRLQRFYRIPILSKLLRRHMENVSRDRKVRYLADSSVWKHLDNMDPEVYNTNEVKLQMLGCKSLAMGYAHSNYTNQRGRPGRSLPPS